jgi:hypothetical protein
VRGRWPRRPLGRGSPESSAANALSRRSEQHPAFLAKANEVRVARARLKRELSANKVDLASILRAPPACVQTATLSELLRAVPGLGPVRTRRPLTRCRISETKTLAGLSDRQRGELVGLLHPQ